MRNTTFFMSLLASARAYSNEPATGGTSHASQLTGKLVHNLVMSFVYRPLHADLANLTLGRPLHPGAQRGTLHNTATVDVLQGLSPHIVSVPHGRQLLRRNDHIGTARSPLQSKHAGTIRTSASNVFAPGRELTQDPPASLGYPGPLSSQEVAEFFEKGFIVVRGLLKGELLKRAREKSFDKPQMGVYEGLGLDAWKKHEDPFLEVATSSPLVEVAAQLTPHAVEEGLYVLKDAFFLAVGGNQGCGWHVDDPVFWPASQQHPGPGVNVWLVLDEVTAEGGGLAVATGSHREEFLGARSAILNENGQINTCAMADIAPEWNAKLEAIKEVPTLQPGDAIVQTRYLFHRMDPFADGSEAQRGPGIARYSVRYVPGNARLDGGFIFKDGKSVNLHGEIRNAAANGFPVFPKAVLQQNG